MAGVLIVTNNRKQAAAVAPAGTVKLIKVEGGYHAFQSMTDYAVWKRQK